MDVCRIYQSNNKIENAFIFSCYLFWKHFQFVPNAAKINAPHIVDLFVRNKWVSFLYICDIVFGLQIGSAVCFLTFVTTAKISIMKQKVKGRLMAYVKRVIHIS